MAKSWAPGDVIRVPAFSGGFRVWQVESVELGGENQESVVGIRTLDRHPADFDVPRMYVPVEILEHLTQAGEV